jgi:hypothetical protein
VSALTTLEQAAAERERLRAVLEVAKRHRDELEPKWHAANSAVREAAEDLARLDLAVGSAKLAHLVATAMQELGIVTHDPPMLVGPRGGLLPDVFAAVAVSTEGVVLYARTPRGRRDRRGKDYSIRPAHVPQPVTDKLAELHAIHDQVRGLSRELSRDEQDAQRKLLRLEVKRAERELAALLGNPHNPGMGPRKDVDLHSWETRGTGDFGPGSGAIKPLAPPSGGRWRWLKVREQAELDGGE